MSAITEIDLRDQSNIFSAICSAFLRETHCEHLKISIDEQNSKVKKNPSAATEIDLHDPFNIFTVVVLGLAVLRNRLCGLCLIKVKPSQEKNSYKVIFFLHCRVLSGIK